MWGDFGGQVHRRRTLQSVIALAAVCVVVLCGAAPAAASLPGRFQDTVAITGLAQPTVVRFSPDGRVFVAEKTGIVVEYDSLADTTPTTVVDINADVNSQADRGLLGFTLDPNFPISPYLYLLYANDVATGAPTVTKWNDVCLPPPDGPGDTDGCPITGKLVRLTLAGNTVTDSTTLIQGEWCQQFKSHSIGDLNFGPDGYLYASAGEGASFINPDWGQFGGSTGSPVLANPCGDPPGSVGVANSSPTTAEGGALRSQSLRRQDGPALLNGTIIRVDPSTGAGAPDNPLASSTDPNARRIVAYGLRNPFRFTFRPGTNDLWIGDVGWNTWEEIDVDTNVTGAANNYGWPCYEGFKSNDKVPQFSALTLCSSLNASSVTDPYFVYQHQQPVVNGENCPNANSAISGISFYSGATYPASYDGAVFFADHSRNCIWVLLPGSNGLPDPSSPQVFEDVAAHPVDLVAGPGGDLFYVDINDGEIHRISYAAPAVTLTAPSSGSETTVRTPMLSGAAGTATGDLPGITVRIYSGSTATGTPVQTLTTTAGGASWSTSAAPLADGQYTAQAEQLDDAGGRGSSTTTFTIDATPPAVTLTTPADGSATNATTPTLSGAAGTATGDLSTITVRIYNGTTATGSPTQTLTTTATAASWAVTPGASLPDGQYTAQAEQDDSLGNQGLSTPTVFTVDTTRPVNLSLPAISGSPSVGQTLQCSVGSWLGLTPRTFAEAWLRDGRAIAGAAGTKYVLAPTDARHTLTCQVTARSVAGSTSATSVGLFARDAAGTVGVGRAHVRGAVVTVPISCSGIRTQSCTAALTMTVREKRRGNVIIALAAARLRGSRTSTRTFVLAAHTVVLRGGARATVRLTLDRLGNRLLSTRPGFPARLTTVQRTGRRQHVVDDQVLAFKGTRAR